MTQKGAIPWQKRGDLGFLKAAWETIKYVLLKPGEFFDNLEIKTSIWEPYAFYFFVTLVSGIVSLAVEMLLRRQLFIAAALKSLLLAPVGIFIAAALVHLGVVILGGKGGFKKTFNVLAYNAASWIFFVIPAAGVVIGTLWGIVVVVQGLRKMHGFSVIRAAVAYFYVFFIIVFISLLAAILVPNFRKARVRANENLAKATVRMISTAADAYSMANSGQYPLSEQDLQQGDYSSGCYNGSTRRGYSYSLSLNQDGYKIIAAPEVCGSTGVKVFMAQTEGEAMVEMDCE